MANGDFIYNETLSGTIDGVNKDFTTLYNIDKIEEVYFLGATYRDISFTGNVVTFTDAPPLGSDAPTIDYFRVNVSPLSPSGDVTFGEIIDDIYAKIGQTRGTGNTANKVYKESLIGKYINNGFSRIKNLRLYKDVMQQYSFNKAKDGSIIGYNANYLNIGENVLYVPASGITMFRGNSIMDYSAYTGGHLNGIPGIVYESGDNYIIGYKIPTGVKKVMEVTIEGEPLNYYDIREFNIGVYGFSIYRKSNGDEYILLPFTIENEIVTVKYQPVYSIYEADSDIVGIEREYYEVLSFYTLRKLFQYREDDRWQQAEKDYRELLKEYKSYKSRAVDGINNTLKSDILTDF